MDGELIYIIFSFAPCFFFHLHHTTTCIFKLTHNVTLGVCFLFFDIYIYIYSDLPCGQHLDLSYRDVRIIWVALRPLREV